MKPKYDNAFFYAFIGAVVVGAPLAIYYEDGNVTPIGGLVGAVVYLVRYWLRK